MARFYDMWVVVLLVETISGKSNLRAVDQRSSINVIIISVGLQLGLYVHN